MMVTGLHVANIICLVIGVIGLMLTLYRSNEIIGCTFTIIVAFVGILTALTTNFLFFAFFALLAIVDTLFILINAIMLIVTGVQWKKYCAGEITIEDDSSWSCHHFHRDSYWSFIVIFTIFLFIAFICRLITVACIGLLIRLYYYSFDEVAEKEKDQL